MYKSKIRIYTKSIDGESVEGKECSVCGEWKSLNLYYIEPDRKGGYRYVARCKECRSADFKDRKARKKILKFNYNSELDKLIRQFDKLQKRLSI